jgi:hypothetical protein
LTVWIGRRTTVYSERKLQKERARARRDIERAFGCELSPEVALGWIRLREEMRAELREEGRAAVIAQWLRRQRWHLFDALRRLLDRLEEIGE